MKKMLHGLMMLGFGAAVFAGAANVPMEEQTTERLRDPFWPVGYIPVADRSPDEEQEETIDDRETTWPALPVRGSSRAADRTYRALVEGVGIVEEGDIVSLPHQGLWFHWRIGRIDSQRLRFTRLGITSEQYPSEAWFRARQRDADQNESRTP